jgi:hypothetical protein
MTVLEHAKVYVDLPKAMQDDDALEFARAVVTLYKLLDKAKAELADSGNRSGNTSGSET